MSKKLRGSYHVDGRRSLTLSTEADDKLVDVGFRLVFDEAYRVRRGGSWYNAADLARAANRHGHYPGRRNGLLGLRLAFDREGQ
jgi:formylglycine-generating enzyme required for sulfatase activity